MTRPWEHVRVASLLCGLPYTGELPLPPAELWSEVFEEDLDRDDDTTPEDAVGSMEERSWLRELLVRCLPPRHYEAIAIRYGLDDGIDRTLDETGAALGCSRSRAAQIVNAALRTTRRAIAAERRHALSPVSTWPPPPDQLPPPGFTMSSAEYLSTLSYAIVRARCGQGTKEACIAAAQLPNMAPVAWEVPIVHATSFRRLVCIVAADSDIAAIGAVLLDSDIQDDWKGFNVERVRYSCRKLWPEQLTSLRVGPQSTSVGTLVEHATEPCVIGIAPWGKYQYRAPAFRTPVWSETADTP